MLAASLAAAGWLIRVPACLASLHRVGTALTPLHARDARPRFAAAEGQVAPAGSVCNVATPRPLSPAEPGRSERRQPTSSKDGSGRVDQEMDVQGAGAHVVPLLVCRGWVPSRAATPPAAALGAGAMRVVPAALTRARPAGLSLPFIIPRLEEASTRKELRSPPTVKEVRCRRRLLAGWRPSVPAAAVSLGG